MPTYTQGQESEVLPEGTYDFAVADAKAGTSKAGNEMIELQLSIITPDGKNGPRVWDYLVFAPDAYWKIDAFRISTGETLVKGQPATFDAEDCTDRTGKVRLMIEAYQGRDKNKVETYIDPAAEKAPPAPKKVEPPSLAKEFDDDDIPMK